MIHRLYCKNSKCYSKLKRFETLNVDQKKDLNTLTLSIIKCIFKAAQNWLFSIHNQNADLQFEQLQLQYISFISEIAQKPLLGYLELRQYQNNKLNNNSTYFVEITNKLADQLKKQITDNQVRQNSKAVLIHEQRTQLIEISLIQQWQTQNLYENLLQTYIYLVDQKIDHWQNLINGYPSLNPFQYNTQKLCEKIMNVMYGNMISSGLHWISISEYLKNGLIQKQQQLKVLLQKNQIMLNYSVYLQDLLSKDIQNEKSQQPNPYIANLFSQIVYLLFYKNLVQLKNSLSKPL